MSPVVPGSEWKNADASREWPGVLALAAVLLGMPHKSRYRRSWRGSVIGGDLPREHRLLSGRVWTFLQVEPTAAVHLPDCDDHRTPPRGGNIGNAGNSRDIAGVAAFPVLRVTWEHWERAAPSFSVFSDGGVGWEPPEVVGFHSSFPVFSVFP